MASAQETLKTSRETNVTETPKLLVHTNSISKDKNTDSAGPTNGAYANFLCRKLETTDTHVGKSRYPSKGQLIKSRKFEKPEKIIFLTQKRSLRQYQYKFSSQGFCRKQIETISQGATQTWRSYAT